MQERARLGCNFCLSTDAWSHRACPLRESDDQGYRRTQPLISDPNRCPVNGASLCQPAYAEILLALDLGVYPYEGGSLDQPHAFVEALNHVKGHKNAAESERYERAKPRKK